MASYPIRVEKYSARHHGGTKDYHVVLLTSPEGRSVFIKRYGKAEKAGQMEVEVFNTEAEGRKAWNAVFKAKFDREYSQRISDSNTVCGDQAAFLRALGPTYRFSIGKEALLALDPTIDVSAVKEPKVTRWEQRPDGTFGEVFQPKTVVEAPPEVYSTNPLWGSI